MACFKRGNSFIRLESTSEGFTNTEVQCFERGSYKLYFIANEFLTKDKAIDILCGCSPLSEEDFNKALSEAKEWIAQL